MSIAHAFSNVSVTSFREFARNTAVRKKAIREKNPLIIEDKKEKEVFLLVPQEVYGGLWEMYEDWKDSQILKEAQNSTETGKDWNVLKSEFWV